jgi:hypothetical protein
MLKITVPAGELHDPVTDFFYYTKETTIVLEHSLVSLSKWEAKWKVPFLNQEHPTHMFNDYVRCMTITQNVDPNVYLVLTPDIQRQIKNYIEDSMTAAVIHETNPQHQSTKFVTSDLIYYWMTALNIPFECQKWHLSRLLTLIRIANIENKPSKDRKMSKAESARRHHAVNSARRAKKARR